MISKEIVRSCLYNWLGYGNLNGTVWFIGTEEGGAEIWRQATQTLESSLNHRSRFELSMDFRQVWEEIYDIPLESFRGPCVWRYMAAFLMSLKGETVTTENINSFVFRDKELGSINSDHFMCELLPLPKRRKESIVDYDFVWSSIEKYRNEVMPKRLGLIVNTLETNKGINVIISYENLLTKDFLSYFENKGTVTKQGEFTFKKENYVKYEIQINTKRKVAFLSTPFFGNGCISYEGISRATSSLFQVG
jgi:hypothetical protein